MKSDTVLPALLLVEDLSQLLSIDAPSQHGDKSAGDHHMQVSNAPPGQSLCREARRNTGRQVKSASADCADAAKPLDGADSPSKLHAWSESVGNKRGD